MPSYVLDAEQALSFKIAISHFTSKFQSVLEAFNHEGYARQTLITTKV